jgi:hypothetical protein
MRAFFLSVLLAFPVLAAMPDAGTPKDPNEIPRGVARAFFEGLVGGDANDVVPHLALPFQLDGKRLNDKDQVFEAIASALREKRTDLLTLYGVELLSPQEMEKRYGKPPARLAQLPYRAGHTLIAIGNLSGHAGVAVLHEMMPNHWAVIAYTD